MLIAKTCTNRNAYQKERIWDVGQKDKNEPTFYSFSSNMVGAKNIKIHSWTKYIYSSCRNDRRYAKYKNNNEILEITIL